MWKFYIYKKDGVSEKVQKMILAMEKEFLFISQWYKNCVFVR